MSSKQRVFAHSSNINYNDYLKNKGGIVLINNINSKNISKVVNRFINYEQFLMISKAYFKYKQIKDCEINPLKNIYDSNTSLLIYDKLLYHINTCSHCTKQINIINCFSCQLLKNVLYPYGEYINIYPQNNFYFPSTLNLEDFCIKKKNTDKCKEIIDFIKNDNITEDNVYNKCKKEKCKNTKSLFI